MPHYCNQCHRKLGFLSYKYREPSSDGSWLVLCKRCRQDAVTKAHARFAPFQLSEGYTRIKAAVFPGAWRIPAFCTICSSEEGPLSQTLLSVVGMSIPLYSCRQCSSSGLDAAKYIRYHVDPNHVGNLTLDIGNPAVADRYVAFLDSELANVKRNLESRTEPLEATFGSGGGTIPIYPSIFRDIAAGVGVKDVTKVLPTDPSFER